MVWAGAVLTLVTVDTVLALYAGLARRPIEALLTFARADAVHAVQTEAVPRAHILILPGAGLALWAKKAGTARFCLKGKDEVVHGLSSALGTPGIPCEPACFLDSRVS